MGIDPGLNITGYAIIESRDRQLALAEAGVVRTNRSDSLEKKLQEIAFGVGEIIEQFKPDVLAIEEVYSHYDHPCTAIVMGHARGVVLLKAAEAGLEVVPYASTRIKKSLTGNGRASKRQMQLMVKSLLSLPKVPEPPDTADALAIALCHCRSLQQREVLV